MFLSYRYLYDYEQFEGIAEDIIAIPKVQDISKPTVYARRFFRRIDTRRVECRGCDFHLDSVSVPTSRPRGTSVRRKNELPLWILLLVKKEVVIEAQKDADSVYGPVCVTRARTFHPVLFSRSRTRRYDGLIRSSLSSMIQRHPVATLHPFLRVSSSVFPSLSVSYRWSFVGKFSIAINNRSQRLVGKHGKRLIKSIIIIIIT